MLSYSRRSLMTVIITVGVFLLPYTIAGWRRAYDLYSEMGGPRAVAFEDTAAASIPPAVPDTIIQRELQSMYQRINDRICPYNSSSRDYRRPGPSAARISTSSYTPTAANGRRTPQRP